MIRVRAAAMVTLAAGLVSACGGETSNVVRGKGLEVADLPPVTQAQIYEAAARNAFDVDNTSLLLDRRILPRTIGLADSGSLAAPIVTELRNRGVVRGTCEPPLAGTRGTARCPAEYPGYVIRYSPIFAIKADSVQVYLYSQKYDTPASGNSELLRFERAYQVARRGDGWRAVREGNVSKEARGEK